MGYCYIYVIIFFIKERGMSNKRRDWYEDNKDDENLADVYPTVDFGGEYHDQEVDESEDEDEY
jgi:hypothetical protein